MEKQYIEKEKIIKQIKNYLTSQPEVSWAYLYGSFLAAQEFDDIDIAVYLYPEYLAKQPSRFKIEQRLAADLERYITPRCEIDLKILNYAPIRFQYKMLKSGKLIYSRNRKELIRYEGNTISYYLDYKPSIEFFDKAMLRRIGQW